MVEADQGYEGQPSKTWVKYKHGVSETSLMQRQGQGHMEKQSTDGSRIFGY